MGATSQTQVQDAPTQLFANLDELGLDVPGDPEFTVQNMVSSADMGEQLNLNGLAIGLGLEDVEYEPEQFPGLVYRLDGPDVVTLLFGSGKVVITAATQPDDSSQALTHIRSQLDDLDLIG